jgi:hypothetical protein
MRIDSSGKLLVGGISTTLASEPCRINGDTGTNGSGVYPATVVLSDSRAYNSTNPPAGGGIAFSYKYTTGGSDAVGPSIQGFKENTTDGNYAGALRFLTRGNGSNPAERMRIDSSGNVGIGTTTPSEKLNVSGNILATGNVTAYSDARLKSDVETLDGSKVYEMRGVSFTKDGEAGSGVIAQELQKVAPELVNDSGEYLSVAYGNLVGYLIEAVKELKAEIDELKGAK